MLRGGRFSTFVQATLSFAVRFVSRPASACASDLEAPVPLAMSRGHASAFLVVARCRMFRGPGWACGSAICRRHGSVDFPSSSSPFQWPLSQAQTHFNAVLQDAAQSLMSPGSAPAAVRTYDAVLKPIAEKLRLSVSPIEGEDAVLAVFGPLVLLGPKTAPPTAGRPSALWNYVKLVVSAVAPWYAARGRRAIFAAGWSPRMEAFWNGIKQPLL